MKIICLVLLFAIQFCSGSGDKKVNSIIKDTILPARIDKGKIFSFTFIDTIPVYTKLKITPVSLDSILTEVTFINEWSKSVLLYKPLIPDGSMTENTFLIFEENRSEDTFSIVEYCGPQNIHEYYSDTKEPMPLIIPDMETDNFIKLNSGDSFSVKVNIAKWYNFKILKRKKNTILHISYMQSFPFIQNGAHLFIEDTTFRTMKPVYLHVTGSNNLSENSLQEFVLPNK